MTHEEAIELLSDSFPLLYYYIRLNLKIERKKAVKDRGSIVKGSNVELKTIHFSTLWLIGVLAQEQCGGCMGNTLRDLVLWKHPIYKKDANKRFNADVLDKLEAAGFITRDRKHPHNRTTNLVELTEEGSQFLERLKDVRRENIKKVFKLLDLKSESEVHDFTVRFDYIAKRAWARTKRAAKKDEANRS